MLVVAAHAAAGVGKSRAQPSLPLLVLEYAATISQGWHVPEPPVILGARQEEKGYAQHSHQHSETPAKNNRTA